MRIIKNLIALMHQSSNQILMDMKNIYKFKDNIDFHKMYRYIACKVINYIPK